MKKRKSKRWLTLLIFSISVMIFTASDCSTDTEEPAEIVLDFQISLSQDILIINEGSSTDIIITARLFSSSSIGNWFKVEITGSNPAAISVAGCANADMNDNSGTCTLIVSVPSGTAAGEYKIELLGTATLTDDRTSVDTKTLTITVPSPTQDFNIAFATDSITVEQSKSATVAINITRITGNTEGIDFQINSQPPGFNGTMSPSSNVTGNTTNYMLTVDQTIPPGNYPVIVTGTGITSGISRTDTLIVIVTAPPLLWVNETPAGFENITFWDVFFINENDGVTVGENGTIFSSADGGDNWSDQSDVTSSRLFAVHSNGSVWYAVGVDFTTGLAVIIRNTTGTWEVVVNTIPCRLIDVFVIDNNNVWVVAINGFAYRTTDGGVSWTLEDQIVTGLQIATIWFTNSSEGYIGASSTTTTSILKTTNGGDDWNVVHTLSDPVIDIFFINSQKGYAVHSLGIEVTTSGGGTGTWSSLSTIPPGIILGIDAISFWGNDIGYIVGNNSSDRILRTEDGDASWEVEQSSASFLWSVAALNENAAVAVGSGIIVRRQ